jgi:AGCS family alanine or glycine:cation symporter
MFGVFIDTIIVCSCTAFIVLLSGAYVPGAELKGVQLTQAALNATLGNWGGHFLAVALFLFCFSSIIGNYAYAEGNVEFIKNNKGVMLGFRLLVLFMVGFGAIGSSPLVWDMADLAMGVMALINLFAIVMLSKYVFVLLKDYQQQLKAGQDKPVFDVKKYPEIQAKIHKDVWK